MKSKFERNIMTNKLAVTGLICCILGTAGCVSIDGNKSYLEKECENGICKSNREYTAVCVENADGYSDCTDSGNINYTRGAADFRGYGERSPRDHRITQAGAGNNISAAIPPSIDNEIIEYENGVVEGNEAGQPWNPAAPLAQNSVSSNNGNGLAVPASAGAGKSGSGSGSATGNSETATNGSTSTADGQLQYGNNGNGTSTGSYQTADGTKIKNDTGSQDEDDDAEESSDNRDWLAEEGQSLKELLTMWSDEAGWRLIWKTNRNYTLNAGAMFRGNFADVASALVRAFARARPAPIATFYKGNRVLVVETMEDENAYD